MSDKNSKNPYWFPNNFPHISRGKFVNKITYKVIVKKDYTRVDGTNALYVQIFLNKEMKRIPLDIFVPLIDFDEKKQRVKKRNKRYADLNLLIEKTLADLNEIEVAYRLSKRLLTIDLLLEEFENPSTSVDFIKFYEAELEKEKIVLARSSYVQQRGVLHKLKRYQERILFHEITEELIDKIIFYFRHKEKNSHNTISTLTKNIKKYLGKANKAGIWTPIYYSDIPHRQMRGTITFLTSDEIKKIYQYYKSPFIQEPHKIACAKFLFSCFTGLRISDIQNLEINKIVNQETLLIFQTVKSKRIQQLKLNNIAKELVLDGFIFRVASKEKLRKQVHEVAVVVGIKKHVNYHVSRHSFATNFLIQGGRVEVLQKLLGHSSIDMTMKYVHVVQDVMNEQIMFLDRIIMKDEE